MANEILFSGIGDLTLAESLSAQYILLLADRNALPNHAALVYAGDIQAGGASNVIKVPLVGLMGHDVATSTTTDGAAVANTALTDGSATVTVARYSKSYEASDLARMTQGGIIDPVLFAQDAMMSGALSLTSLIANLVDNFATVVGTTTVDATAGNFLDAISQLEINLVQGPYMAVLHPVQWGDIRKDLALSVGGAIQFAPATAEFITTRGIGFQGSLAGVDVFTSSFVPTANAGADRAGGMFGRGAIVWADGTIPLQGLPTQVVIGSKVLFEMDRTAKSGLTAYVSHVYLGASEGIDLAGVSIITDA